MPKCKERNTSAPHLPQQAAVFALEAGSCSRGSHGRVRLEVGVSSDLGTGYSTPDLTPKNFEVE
jgi:hypothetical protein